MGAIFFTIILLYHTLDDNTYCNVRISNYRRSEHKIKYLCSLPSNVSPILCLHLQPACPLLQCVYIGMEHWGLPCRYNKKMCSILFSQVYSIIIVQCQSPCFKGVADIYIFYIYTLMNVIRTFVIQKVFWLVFTIFIIMQDKG